jgi:hypothetical protein
VTDELKVTRTIIRDYFAFISPRPIYVKVRVTFISRRVTFISRISRLFRAVTFISRHLYFASRSREATRARVLFEPL